MNLNLINLSEEQVINILSELLPESKLSKITTVVLKTRPNNQEIISMLLKANAQNVDSKK